MNDNRIMTDQNRADIDTAIKTIIADETHRQKAYLALALALADDGSSPNVELKGTFDINGKDVIDMHYLLSVIKQHVTPRQFARFYAKVIYQYMRANNRPPANWIGKGYPYEARFAAFDFFDAVSSPEAMEPEGGLQMLPTVAEMRIYNTNKIVSIRRRGLTPIASSLPEVTRGQVANNPTNLAIGSA